MGAATFIPLTVTEENMTLDMLVPNDKFIAAGSVIMFIAPDGGNATEYSENFGQNVQKSFQYQTADQAVDGEGWYYTYDVEEIGGESNQNKHKIPYGEGFLVYISGVPSGQELTYSGAVKSSPTTSPIPNQGYNILGNCSPVKLFLKDLTPNTKFYESKSLLMFVSEDGGNATVYSEELGETVQKSFIYQKEKDYVSDGDGWYFTYDIENVGGEANQNNKISLNPGEGFFVYRTGSDSSQRVEIPPAIEEPVKD